MGKARYGKRLWLKRIVVKLIEVAFKVELILCPDAFQTCDEFPAATVSLGVI